MAPTSTMTRLLMACCVFFALAAALPVEAKDPRVRHAIFRCLIHLPTRELHQERPAPADFGDFRACYLREHEMLLSTGWTESPPQFPPRLLESTAVQSEISALLQGARPVQLMPHKKTSGLLSLSSARKQESFSYALGVLDSALSLLIAGIQFVMADLLATAVVMAKLVLQVWVVTFVLRKAGFNVPSFAGFRFERHVREQSQSILLEKERIEDESKQVLR